MTKVIIEYQYLKPTEGVNYAATITFFDWNTVAAKLKQSFQHLNNRFFPPEQEDDSNSDSLEEDSEIIDQKYRTAKGVFQALFRTWPPFQDDLAIKEYLLESRYLPLRDDIQEEILRHAEQLYWQVREGYASEPITAQTAAQLWERLMPFTHGQEEDSIVLSYDPWPFVEIVS